MIRFSESGLLIHPEMLVTILVGVLLIVDNLTHPIAILLGVVIIVLSVLVWLINPDADFFTQYDVEDAMPIGLRLTAILSIILLSFLGGFYVLNGQVLLACFVLGALRMLQTSNKCIGWLFTFSSVTFGAGLFLGFELKLDLFDWNNGFYVAYGVLLLSLLVVLWHFWQHQQELSYAYEEIELRQQRVEKLIKVTNSLARFMPIQLWQPIIRDNVASQVANKRAKLTILFSDIAGFTELSENLSSDALADILNTYMDRMTLLAKHHGAVLDKFIGDGMLCFFGAPDSKGDRADALACVAMAIDMRREMRKLRQKWQLQGFDGLYVRIGINTGYCHVGNFGSNNRMSYTLIGKEANLASRLESAAKPGQILISQSTLDYVQHHHICRQVEAKRIKGFELKVECWEVLDPDETDKTNSDWIDHELSGFNLHLNFKDIKNYDYQEIKKRLYDALERVEIEDQKKSL